MPLWEQPFKLLIPSQDHSGLVVNSEGFKKLDTLVGYAVSVVSVIGNQRSGKSTLMNLLMHRLERPKCSGFQVRSFFFTRYR